MKYKPSVGSFVIVGLWAAFVCLPSRAQNTTCANAIKIIPDGSIHDVSFTAAGQSRWFRFGAGANRSYALMSETMQTALSGGQSSTNLVSGSCAGSPLPNNSFTFEEPMGDSTVGGGSMWIRRAFKLTAETDVFFTVAGSTGQMARVRVVETTQFSPLWSTFNIFETFYRFQNTTNGTCSVTLRLVNDANIQVANETFTVLANRTSSTRNTGPTDLNLTDNQAGQAVITHDCSPGAIQVDGFLRGVNPGGGLVVLPVKIVTARQER